MTDLAERKRRVEIIANTLHGRVLDRAGDLMHVEIPADMGGAAASMFGMGGFSAVITGQDARLAPRRVTTPAQGRCVIDPDAQDLMVFYTYKIELQDRHAKVLDPLAAVAAITRQVKP